MRIGELATRTGVSERALRYYETQGLLTPSRTPSGYRKYAESDLAAVRRIRTLLAAGLNTTQIQQVLPCLVDDDGLLTPTCSDLTAGLIQQRDRIDEAIHDLQTTRTNLTKLITSQPAD
ncbi:MerR family transcriptional regulator [Kribbella sp. HUAS MG21]|jgi:DNA-binding transcriptional MerR regulator|uniref:MerR family transcriptional regulator n=1 Tax=Kribbella sp. HUAS MG21 TaxID=3160966 RepID=A0AAU7TB30_9ACTN